MVPVAVHERAQVSDHVGGTGLEVLVVVAAADGALVDDHHPHLVHDVEHVGADWLLVQAGHVEVEALPVIHGLRPARIVGRRRQEPWEQVVGVRVVLGAGGLDAVVVRALDVVAAELDGDTVQLVVRGDLTDLAEPEANRDRVRGSRAASGCVRSHGHARHMQLGPVALHVGDVRPPVRGCAQPPRDRAQSHLDRLSRWDGDRPSREPTDRSYRRRSSSKARRRRFRWRPRRRRSSPTRRC